MIRFSQAASRKPQLGLGLPVAAGLEVIRQRGAGDCQQDGRYNKGAQHWRNAPAGLDQFVGRWLSRFI
jgi:hypothetical protein